MKKLTRSELLVIGYMQKHGPLLIEELAEGIGRTAKACAQLLWILGNEGLIEKAREEGKRFFRYSLTNKASGLAVGDENKQADAAESTPRTYTARGDEFSRVEKLMGELLDLVIGLKGRTLTPKEMESYQNYLKIIDHVKGKK